MNPHDVLEMDSPQVEFDWSQDPKTLRDRYLATKFDALFEKQIAKSVIEVLSPQLVPDPHNLIYDDDLVYKRLIGPLERFMFQLTPDAPQNQVDAIFSQLKTLKQPSKVCRKVLKTGDVLFSCNDCGLDETCVVCIDCFHKSAHKDHNYRMSNTDGGGCCDCGDHEAWRQHPACSDHQANDQPNLKLADYEHIEMRKSQLEADRKGILDKISLLPAGFAERFFLVCQASLQYARTMLTWEDFHALPKLLDVSVEARLENDETLLGLLAKEPSSKNFFTVLFNDEVHTYDHVIMTLVKIIKCTKMTASIIASSVSREGRSLILQDTYRPCKQVSDSIACIRDSGQGPLKVEVVHSAILAHQAFALKLIEWIKRMALICDAYRVLTAYTLLGPYTPIPGQEVAEDEDDQPACSGDMSLLEKVMRSNTSFWKLARIDWNDLFVATLLTEYSIKDKFARLITRNYPDLVQDFINDDHDHSVSVLTMTTQLYTVPSLICMLIEEENALTIIVQKLISVCRASKREDTSMSYENRNTFDMHGLKRGFYMIHDIRHLINIEPTQWTERLRANVIEAVTIFLDLLESMQNMDSVKRQLGQHLEYEQEWETGMSLQSRLISLITRLVTYCSLDEFVLTETLRETQRRLFTRFNNFKTIKRELFNHKSLCIHYDVSLSPVSVHLPLTRFAAALIVELMQKRPSDRVPYKESLIILAGNVNGMIDIMEPSLRTQVMIGQSRSGMWRRNGFSLSNQIMHFAGARMRKEMYDRDILVLQECAATLEANQFLVHMINKFNLINWLTSETTREPLVGSKAISFHNDEETMTQTMSLGEEFLQLLLTIVSERYRVGIGCVSSEDVIKNEIIQLLCIKPFTRSDITIKLFYNDHEIDCIKAVADLRRSGELSTGKYELKSELYDRFNPFFYHYNRQNQSQALDAQLKRKRNAKETLVCCPPPKPVELTQQFRNLNNLIKCDITLIIIQKILQRAIQRPDPKSECSTKAPIRFQASDLQLDQCLHLIGLGLHEQERDLINFNYLLEAQSKNIWSLLRECYEHAKRSRDLITWLMQKAGAVLERLEMCGQSVASGSCDLSELRQCFGAVLSACDTNKQDSKKRNSELATQRRERIMALMKAKQDKFLSNPATRELAAETSKHEAPKSTSARLVATGTTSATSSSASLAASNQQQQQSSIYLPPANVPLDYRETSEQAATACTASELDDEQTGMDYESCEEVLYEGGAGNEIDAPAANRVLCILCRDEQVVGFDKPTMVLLAYVQRSAVLSKNRHERRIPNYSLTPSNHLKHLTQANARDQRYSYTSDNGWSFDATHMPADLFFGPFVSTCGHAMHHECWCNFSDAIYKRESTRPNRASRHASFDLEKSEILCPLCECISNATIPLLPDFSRFRHRRQPPVMSPPVALTIFNASEQTIESSSEHLTAFLHALKGTVTSYKHVRHLSTTSATTSGTSTSAASSGHSYALASSPPNAYEDKYMRLLQPTTINDVLKELDEREALVLRDFIATIRQDKLAASTCTKSLLGTIQALAERIHAVGLDLDRSLVDIHHARIFMMTSWSIAYTIQAHERAARFKGAPLFEDLESAKNLCLSSLIRFACASMMTHQSDMIQSLLVQKLRYLLVGEEHQTSSPCVLDIDALELFVSIFIMLQKLYSHIDDTQQQHHHHLSSQQQPQDLHHEQPMQSDPLDLNISSTSSTSVAASASSSSSSPAANASPAAPAAAHFIGASCRGPAGSGGHSDMKTSPSTMPSCGSSFAWTTGAYDHEYFRNLLHLMVLLNMVQVTISMQTDDAFKKGEAQASGELSDDLEVVVLHNFYKDIILASGHPSGKLCAPTRFFVERMKCALLPFLRSCAVFLYQLSHVKPEVVLQTSSAFNEDAQPAGPTPLSSTMDEFNAICKYLDLPSNFDRLLRSSESRNLALSWLRHSRVLLLIKAEQERKREDSQDKLQVQLLQRQPTRDTSTSELMPVRLIRQPHSVNRLIDLPYDYSELVDKVSSFTCPSIKNEDSRTPTMCLVCGLMLCSQSYCCQRDLNDLAANYMQTVERQEENRQQWMATNAAESERTLAALAAAAASGATPTGGGPTTTTGATGGYPQGSAAAAAASLHTGALTAISLLFPQTAGAGGGGGGPTREVTAAHHNHNHNHNHHHHHHNHHNHHHHQREAALGRLPTVSAAAYSLFHAHISQQLVGSCTYHAHECSGGVGIFLRIRSCQILLLSGRSKGCYMPAPYIDDHGETDFGLLRGNPLHLNKSHYTRLQHLWMNHAIPEQVSRSLEYSSYASTINWHLH